MVKTLSAMALLGLLLAACTAKTEDALPDKVRAVVERTKTTQATYALYSWNKIQRPEGPLEEWSAEFHSGHLHRVETPRDRVIADCQAGTGSAFSLVTNKTVTGPRVAMSACGVNTNKRFVGAEHLGTVQTPFGPADRVRVADLEDIRTYDITANGAIVGETMAPNKLDAPAYFTMAATEVAAVLPDPNMFDQASLARSYVPDRLKVAPKP